MTEVSSLGVAARFPQSGDAAFPGITTVTVSSVAYVKHTGSLVGPKSGNEYAAAEVRVCAGARGSHSVQGVLTLFSLISASGTSVSSNVVLPSERPVLSYVHEIGADSCTQGYLSFEIAKGTTLSEVLFGPEHSYSYAWRLPAG